MKREFGENWSISHPYLDQPQWWNIINIPENSEGDYIIEANITDNNAKKDWWYKFTVNNKTGTVTYLSKKPA